mgnify:CR=1 FL=1
MKPFNTANAPQAIGAYSQAMIHQGVLYVSGQIPLPATGTELISQEFIAQAHQVFKILRAIATAAGSSLNQAIKLNVFLTDLSCFASLNEVMSQYCQEPYPARAAIEVSALPKGALIEIDGMFALED